MNWLKLRRSPIGLHDRLGSRTDVDEFVLAHETWLTILSQLPVGPISMKTIEEAMVWWETLVATLRFERQHFHDYLKDLEGRRLLADRIFQIDEPDRREALICRLKIADEKFIEVTRPFPGGLIGWPASLHPDRDWFFGRIPQVVGGDFPEVDPS